GIVKDDIKKWIQSIKFDKNKSNYIFVYELKNKDGGDNFAKMIINPNRKDLIGKYISTNYKDINGFEFRKKFLKDINLYGESNVSYSYKKTNGNIENKISYFKYYKPLNWIIAKGIYNDDLKQLINNKKSVLKEKVIKQIKQNIFYFICFSSIAILFAYIIGKKIETIITEKDKKVKNTTKALAALNRELDSRVKKEVQKNREQEQILMQKSKFISLGETISLIAHQWRQPISELNAILLNIRLHHKLGKLDIDMMDNKSSQMENILIFMSQTIDDFSTFFKPNKAKERFIINQSISRVLAITKAVLDDNEIKIDKDINNTLYLYNFQNEFEQVLLNIILNAKDALVDDKITNKKIKIEVFKKDKKIVINIIDNANGIKQSIKEKIFEPYFTTKSESHGTGIGLYISKIIIENNMNGKLKIVQRDIGSCFQIVFSTKL
ncbi:MAG: cache domain-containing protein, partial [Campylobacterota bacterium]|nr:cache domain-containing protein [Campylobacterota bacterium]